MILASLLHDFSEFVLPDFLPEKEITGIVCDSREVKPGSCFVAVRGFKKDGSEFVPQAIQKGAEMIVIESSEALSFLRRRFPNVVFLVTKNARETLSRLSDIFYQRPTSKMKVFGVTGTNGKTTFAYLMESVLKQAGLTPAVVGTINSRYGNKLIASSHTTPEAPILHQFAAEALENGSDSLVMEVSSHALDLRRVDSVSFDGALFTNLTPDHLDYHQNISDYFQAKGRLFGELLEKTEKSHPYAVLNADDPFSFKVASLLTRSKKIFFTLDSHSHYQIFPTQFQCRLHGIEAEVKTPWGEVQIKSPLLGRFNLSNLLGVIGMAGEAGVSLLNISEALKEARGAPGRLERVENKKGIHVFVDYAHTPDALKNVLQTLRELIDLEGSNGKLRTLFGCGGDRDKSKRPLMGKEVADQSDSLIVTSDNPRSEDPKEIVAQILPGVRNGKCQNFEVELDRKKAIEKVLSQSKAGDVVLIAGKGHETYQILKDETIHFDDREIVNDYFGN